MNNLVELMQDFFLSYEKVVLDNTEDLLWEHGFETTNFDGTSVLVEVEPFSIWISTLYNKGCIDYESFLEFKNPQNFTVDQINREICSKFENEIMSIYADEDKGIISIRIAHALLFKKDDLNNPQNEISMLTSLFERIVETSELYGLTFQPD